MKLVFQLLPAFTIFLLILSRFTVELLFRFYFFLAITSGFWRRLFYWLGLNSIGNYLLAILPSLALLITLKILGHKQGKNTLTYQRISWNSVFFILLFSVFFPFSGSLVGTLIAFSSLFPIFVFFLVGTNANSSINLIKIQKDIVIYAFINAVYCTYQFFIGYPIWDATWISNQVNAGFTSLTINGFQRPFGFVISPAESSSLMALGFFACIDITYRTKSKIFYRFCALFFIFTVFVVGVRTTIILVLAILLAKYSVLLRAKFSLTLLLGFAVISVLIDRVSSGTGGMSRIYEAIFHPSSTISYNVRKQSSLSILSDLENYPLGHGLAGLVNGSIKYGNVKERATDVILSDAMASMGYIGAIIAIFLIYKCLRYFFRLSDEIPLWVLAIPVVQINYLLNLNHYAITPMAWFSFGLASHVLETRRTS